MFKLSAIKGKLDEYLSVVEDIFLGSRTFCPPPCHRVAKNIGMRVKQMHSFGLKKAQNVCPLQGGLAVICDNKPFWV